MATRAPDRRSSGGVGLQLVELLGARQCVAASVSLPPSSARGAWLSSASNGAEPGERVAWFDGATPLGGGTPSSLPYVADTAALPRTPAFGLV